MNDRQAIDVGSGLGPAAQPVPRLPVLHLRCDDCGRPLCGTWATDGATIDVTPCKYCRDAERDYWRETQAP